MLAGTITVSFRLRRRPKVKTGGRYPAGTSLELIEVDSIELIRFAATTDEDVLRAGEPDRETLRGRRARGPPIEDGTLLYRGVASHLERTGYRRDGSPQEAADHARRWRLVRRRTSMSRPSEPAARATD